MSRLNRGLFLATAGFALFLAILIFTPRAKSAAGSESAIKGDMMTGEHGITETVAQIMERERLTPRKPLTIEEMPEPLEHTPRKVHPPNELNVPSFPCNSNPTSPLSLLLPQTIGTNIAGPGRTVDSISAIPPD